MDYKQRLEYEIIKIQPQVEDLKAKISCVQKLKQDIKIKNVWSTQPHITIHSKENIHIITLQCGRDGRHLKIISSALTEEVLIQRIEAVEFNLQKELTRVVHNILKIA